MRRVLLAAAALLAATAAQAGEIRLKYMNTPLGNSSAQALWKDEAKGATPIGSHRPWALIANVDLGGRTLTVTQLWSARHCGAYTCPVKVFEGDRLLLDDMICDDWDQHTITDDGRLLIACGTLYRINLQ